MRYQIIFFFSGCVWFLIAGITGTAVPVFGDRWFTHLIDAVITGLAVGNLTKPLLSRCFGTRNWFALPFLSVLLGTAIFGLLLPVSWAIASLVKGNGMVEGSAFYQVPLILIIYSMSIYLPIFYPLALLNNRIIYRFIR
ncbi:MAG: hypothetical protein JWQ04_3398 [Pedosphaera sp.]|nr:hypothetical protein [Pedosphaera sp.]